MQETSPKGNQAAKRHGVMVFDLIGVLFDVNSFDTSNPPRLHFTPIQHGLDLLRSVSNINHFAAIITDVDKSYALTIQALLNHYAPELIIGLDYGLYMQPEDTTPIQDMRRRVVESWQEQAKSQGGNVALGIVPSESSLELFSELGIPATVYTEVKPFSAPKEFYPDVMPADPDAVIAEMDRLGLLHKGTMPTIAPAQHQGAAQMHPAEGYPEPPKESPCAGCSPSCGACISGAELASDPNVIDESYDRGLDQMLKYPAYWRMLPKGWQCIDYYRVASLFPLNDPSQRLEHARKKLMLGGLRTGGKTLVDDIREARDTLTGWLIDNDK